MGLPWRWSRTGDSHNEQRMTMSRLTPTSAASLSQLCREWALNRYSPPSLIAIFNREICVSYGKAEAMS